MMGGFKDKVGSRMMKQMTPSEMPITNSLADCLVGIENEQARAIQSLKEAHGLDVPHGHSPEDRRASVLAMADAVASDDFRGWWFQNVAPDILENPEKAESHAELEPQEWADRLRTWYSLYYEKGVVDEPLDSLENPGKIGSVADKHVQATFGVDLKTFVAVVVNWDRGEQARNLLAGPIRRHTQIINMAAAKARTE